MTCVEFNINFIISAAIRPLLDINLSYRPPSASVGSDLNTEPYGLNLDIFPSRWWMSYASFADPWSPLHYFWPYWPSVLRAIWLAYCNVNQLIRFTMSLILVLLLISDRLFFLNKTS